MIKISKNPPWQAWANLYYAEVEVSERRAEALGRVWLVIESQVDDVGLANELRMAIIGDFIPSISVTEHEEEDETVSEVDT